MSVLYILISVSILIASAFLVLFIWAVRSGQYDDTEGPSIRMLFDDKRRQQKKKKDRTN